MKKENYSELIIESANQSKDLYCKALQMAKCQQYVRVQLYLKEANKYLGDASALHLKMFSDDFNRQEYGISLVYAEDVLMSVELYKTMVLLFIDIYKNIS